MFPVLGRIGFFVHLFLEEVPTPMTPEKGSEFRELRYERKFLVRVMDAYEIDRTIRFHPACFSELYPPRAVNSIYMDTVDLAFYEANLAGAGARSKVRIRWYGDHIGMVESPHLEVKSKRGLLGSKIRYALKAFSVDRGYSLEKQQQQFVESRLPDGLVAHLKTLRFALLNRYWRRYFESADRRFRVTVDFKLEFFRIYPADNRFVETSAAPECAIVELKYAERDDEDAHSIADRWPFRLTRSSKYAMGIDELWPVVP